MHKKIFTESSSNDKVMYEDSAQEILLVSKGVTGQDEEERNWKSEQSGLGQIQSQASDTRKFS